MTEVDLFDLIDPVLAALGSTHEDGEEFRDPPLDVLRYDRRPVRLHWLPVLGQALSVVAVVRQPLDVAGTAEGHRALIGRLVLAANGRFPFVPWRRGATAPALALTVIELTPRADRARRRRGPASGVRGTAAAACRAAGPAAGESGPGSDGIRDLGRAGQPLPRAGGACRCAHASLAPLCPAD